MDADFLVIGGGIAGISAAARLAPMGSVLVLEGEDHLAHHTSGRSAALYEPHYGAPPVVGLSLASREYFLSQPGVLGPRGLMTIARADQLEMLHKDADAMNLSMISAEEACAKVPILNPAVVAAGAMSDHAWDIDTDLLIQGFAKVARAHGGRIVTRARVSAIAKVAGGWKVTSAAGEFTAATLINAAGSWVDQVAVMAGVQPIGFQPYRRSMARIPAPGGMMSALGRCCLAWARRGIASRMPGR